MGGTKRAELKLTPAVRGEIIKIVDERIREAHVTREDFTELKGIVRDLGIKIGELAEAQKRTDVRVAELAEAQKNLAEAQMRAEARVAELAEAQKNTELELRKLIGEHRETRRQLGGLAITVGYTLENAAYKGLPELLKKDFGIEIEGRLKRQHVRVGEDRHIEVNIIGEARRDGRRLMIVGECKSQFSKNDVDDFIRRKLELLRGVFGEIFPLAVVHMISEPDAEDYARSKGITVYYSYDL